MHGSKNAERSRARGVFCRRLCAGRADEADEQTVGECTEDGRYSLDACRCIGACGLAPVVTINDEVFGKLVPDDVDGIIDRFDKLEEVE